MRKRQRLAFFAIAGLGLLAAIAPGLAAGIAVPSVAPAAGQGVVEVEGFLVCDIDWTVSDADSKVTQVEFTIERDSDDSSTPRAACGSATSTVDSVVAGTSLDAVVRVQLRVSTTPTGDADWAGCNATAGAAVCPLTGSQQLDAASLASVNIIAFDRN